ncbi:hypothetical protein GOB83_01735 [Acetobacter fabarum]|uniref:hypothetical protein n=1 Tax=Acetobacter fabarum TaxID=483199 RepID=UPI001404A09E|nr:hypothetical protein [Acetobacter fabarum]NHO40928.1 hypothetical protein [Acetobacter fabarum]GBQ33562.1 hypothetical protein AA19596_1238 [Acetobacter fabarum DSM 19596]
MHNATYGRTALLFALCAALGWTHDAAQAQAVDGPTTVCITEQAAQQPQTLVVVPSGTVFATDDTARPGPAGHTPQAQAQAQAVVTTETITLTHMQPCMAADASSVVSHTRHWLHEKVRPHSGQVLHAVGEVSGNGVDTGMEDEDTSLRDLVHSGALSLSINRTVQDPVFLQESDADLPDTGDGVDTSASRDAASDLPSQRHAH